MSYSFNLPEQGYITGRTNSCLEGRVEYNFLTRSYYYNPNRDCFDSVDILYYGRKIGNYLLSKFPNSKYKFIVESAYHIDETDALYDQNKYTFVLQLLIDNSKYCVEFRFTFNITTDVNLKTEYWFLRSTPFPNSVCSDKDFGGYLYSDEIGPLYKFYDLLNNASKAYKEHLDYEKKKNWCLPFCCE